jgi:hypothetical protein
MVSGGNGSADALLTANRPVLLEGLGTLDGRRVGAGADVDVVVCAVASNLTLLLAAAGGVVRAERLDDVVLDQGVLGPAVQREVAVALGAVGARVLDGSRRVRVAR